MTAVRTDVHRPSAPEFDPEAYEFHGVWDLNPSVEDILWGGADIERAQRMKAVNDLVGKGYRFGSHGSGQCGHCGARIRYAALLSRPDVKEMIYVGEQCLDNRFSLTKAEFDAVRKAATARGEQAKNYLRLAAIAEQHPWFAWATYAHNIGAAGATWEPCSESEQVIECGWCDYHDHHQQRPDGTYGDVPRTDWATKTRSWSAIEILSDLVYKARKFDLSDKQHALGEKLVVQLAEAEDKMRAREAEKAAKLAAGVKVPEGRVQVVGTVATLKFVDSQYGGSLKMRVVHDSGWAVWGTVPSSLDVEVGDGVQFTATVEPSGDDPLFGFYKRPTKASKIGAAS